MTTEHELLQAALFGYQHQLEQIESKMADIRAQIGGTSAGTRGPGRRKMSASARQRIAAAQKKRWAEFHKGNAASTSPKKRKMSAAGRKRIAEATKKRWAEYRAKKASGR